MSTESVGDSIGGIAAESPPGDDTRLFIASLDGTVRVFDLMSHELLKKPFLIVPDVFGGSERGCLGFAFDPLYSNNGYVYVYHTSTSERSRLVRYRVSEDPNIADPSSSTPILDLQSSSIHNGGWIGFGSDEYLYLSTGELGSSSLAHNINVLYGKILRIDVHSDDFPDDPARNYGIPPTNPYVGIGGADEVFAYGLRNPWRCSFDRETGDLLIGDVGQSSWEEVNLLPAGSAGGQFFGWWCSEGPNVGFCPPEFPVTFPLFAYSHGSGSQYPGCAIVGGYVYRGCEMPEIYGAYFFSDYCSGAGGMLRYENGEVIEFIDRRNELGGPGWAFGEDARGELYILGPNRVSRIIPAPGQVSGCCDMVESDIARDGRIDLNDLQLLLFRFGTRYDLNDLQDLLALFGTDCYLP